MSEQSMIEWYDEIESVVNEAVRHQSENEIAGLVRREIKEHNISAYIGPQTE